MDDTNTVKPKLSVLSLEQIQQVHAYALKILSTVGVRVDSHRARKLFARTGGSAIIKDDRVFIPAEMVDWAIQTAPSNISIYNRDGTLRFQLPGTARFGIGVTVLYYQDLETDAALPFCRKHMETAVRLGNALPGYDVISTVGILQDVSPQVADLYATLEMTANTVKPLIVLVSAHELFPVVLDLLEHLHGDLDANPSIIPYVNPITPLMINKGTVDKMWRTIERGLPVIYSNYGMAGASTPIMPAGTLALLNAELLAGLTLGQLIREGTPMILGFLPAYFDMQGMGNFYDAASYLLDVACAETMQYYRLPHVGTSGAGRGWGADLIAGGHQWFNCLISCISQVGLAPFIGNNLDSKAFSPAVVVYANDIIEQVRRFAQGFQLDDASVAIDEIAQVGPGGNFLASDLTFAHFRNAYHHSAVFEDLTFEKWQEKGSPRAEDILRGYTKHLLATCQPPEQHAHSIAKGEAFIQDYLRHL
jgi:trimethylamine--corrinoid protein Co-methyltransferase